MAGEVEKRPPRTLSPVRSCKEGGTKGKVQADHSLKYGRAGWMEEGHTWAPQDPSSALRETENVASSHLIEQVFSFLKTVLSYRRWQIYESRAFQ